MNIYEVVFRIIQGIMLATSVMLPLIVLVMVSGMVWRIARRMFGRPPVRR